jgi:hypothetical protein
MFNKSKFPIWILVRTAFNARVGTIDTLVLFLYIFWRIKSTFVVRCFAQLWMLINARYRTVSLQHRKVCTFGLSGKVQSRLMPCFLCSWWKLVFPLFFVVSTKIKFHGFFFVCKLSLFICTLCHCDPQGCLGQICKAVSVSCDFVFPLMMVHVVKWYKW